MEVERYSAVELDEGAGSRVRRAVPAGTDGPMDPFVLFDEFFVPPDGGFPEHPHRGFEIVTYVLEGGIKHRDSSGGSERLGPGDVQRITAGFGVRHSELPFVEGESHGLQLWINLPREEKDAAPGYQFASAEELPEEQGEGWSRVEVVGGGSPVELRRDVRYTLYRYGVDSSHEWRVPNGWRGLLYVLGGRVEGDSFGAGPGELLSVSGEFEEELELEGGSTFVDVSGEPVQEEPLLRGPYVD